MNKQVFNILFFLLLLSGCYSAKAQGKRTGSAIYNEIAHMDSAVFNAFNSRDTSAFKRFFSEDLEFYHDKGGLTGYKETMEFMRSTAKNNNGLKRDLVPGSIQVYPIPGYGAMEIGEHTFCHTKNGRQDCGTFKFVHIWKKAGNEWQITRVISYGH